jgi:xylulokinase
VGTGSLPPEKPLRVPEVFEELGYAVRRVVASDGGAESRVWMQIAADALGRPIELL